MISAEPRRRQRHVSAISSTPTQSPGGRVSTANEECDDVSALSDLMDEQPDVERAAVYDELAAVALRAFDVTADEVHFLGHNSGAAYRVESADAGRLLLKVHSPQGDSEGLPAPAILGGLRWLATTAEGADLPVQTPLPDLSGALLPFVTFKGLSLPCSVQRWLDGQQVDALSTDQAHAVGSLLGSATRSEETHVKDADQRPWPSWHRRDGQPQTCYQLVPARVLAWPSPAVSLSGLPSHIGRSQYRSAERPREQPVRHWGRDRDIRSGRR